MKKICIVVPPNLPMPPVKGGAIETLMQYIADVNEIERKLDITFISLWDEKAEKQAKKYKFSRYVYFHWNTIDDVKWFVFRAIRKLTGINIHVLEPYEYFVSKYVLANEFDAFVNESADFNAFKHVSDILGKERCYAHLHSEFPANRIIDSTFKTIISVSEYIKKQWLKTSKLNPDQVVVLQNCADKERFTKTLVKEEQILLRKQLGLSASDFVVYFCGRIVPEKGILELMNAIISIKDSEVKLLVIGSPNFGHDGKDTPYLEKVKKVIRENKDRVKFTGYIDNKELYKYYSISNCVVVPSTYEDPAPLVPIESLMAGKALIVTNTGGAPEYVTKESAIVVTKEHDLEEQLQEQLLRIKHDASFKDSLEKEARKRAENFTKEQYYNNFVSILNK